MNQVSLLYYVVHWPFVVVFSFVLHPRDVVCMMYVMYVMYVVFYSVLRLRDAAGSGLFGFSGEEGVRGAHGADTFLTHKENDLNEWSVCLPRH